jgi:hypothetical protein
MQVESNDFFVSDQQLRENAPPLQDWEIGVALFKQPTMWLKKNKR